MTSDAEIEAALRAAFNQCEAENCPLTEQQKQILLEIAGQLLQSAQLCSPQRGTNPLDELTTEERLALLQFAKEQDRLNRPWKAKLLNDWLHNRDSGPVQFIRDRYGPQWLNRVKPIHLAKYYDQAAEVGLKLKVGSRIEVCNALWEWVQKGDTEALEWFPCTVVGLYESSDEDYTYTNCLVRFENGAEYEIQGIYEWNHPNWRWTVDN